MTCKETPIEILGKNFPANLVILGTQSIDVILGMNWLAKCQGHLDCARRAVALTTEDGAEVEYVSALNPTKACCHEGIARPSLDEIRIVRNFADVFPEELPDMPPDRDIEFVIELILGTAPIAQDLIE